MSDTVEPAAPPSHAKKRVELAAALATIVLRDGLGTLALRGLAARLNTSDRMLLYYFGTKEQLVLEVLATLEQRLFAHLQPWDEAPRMTAGAFLSQAFALGADPAIAPFMRLWTEVIARGARGEAPYDRIGPEIVRSWTTWIDKRLTPPTTPMPEPRAIAILAIIEGASLLELAAPGSTVGAIPYLATRLDALEARQDDDT